MTAVAAAAPSAAAARARAGGARSGVSQDVERTAPEPGAKSWSGLSFVWAVLRHGAESAPMTQRDWVKLYCPAGLIFVTT